MSQPPGVGASTGPVGNGLALASMIIGIASLVLACCFQGLSFPFGVVAAVLGIIARRQITRSAGAQTGLGQALTGILTGVLSSLLIGGVLFAWLVLGVWEPIPLN